MKYIYSLIALVLLSSTSCMRNTNKELKEVEEMQEVASLSMRDLHTIVTDSGYMKYEFETPEMHQYDNAEEPYIDFPNGLKFRMYSEHGQLTKSRIRCNNAKYYKTRKLWELNFDVEATTEKNDILNTEQLFWDTQNHKIYSDKFVKITTKHQVITGKGFESDEKLSQYEIKRPGGEIELEENK
ncbi:MAG: LPS export ABC transporter periplasmic protein LptC [Bacteroidia bacterium]|nr:LPS export ABC transporter periplasmic protein LptC [Bacteroidia bacterium]